MKFKELFEKVSGLESIDEAPDEEAVNKEVERMRRDSARARSEEIARRNPDLNRKRPVTKPEGYPFTDGKTDNLKIVIIKPRSFEDCPKLVDSLKKRKPVVINLESVETEIAHKIFDFLSGAVYALNGKANQIATNTFIFSPENVDTTVSEEHKGFEFSSASKSPWR